MFEIEDELHAEGIKDCKGLEDAIAELKRLSKIPYGQEPNLAPCVSWRTCGRRYIINEFDDSVNPSRLVQRIDGFEIDASEINWNRELENL
jgi:hypothetical protein